MLNPDTVRWIDRNIGRPVCAILTAHRRFFGRENRDCPISGYSKVEGTVPIFKKILFIKLTEQGSTVLAYSAFRQAAGLVGKENLFVLVFDENRPILDILDIVPASNIIEICSSSLIGCLFSAVKAVIRLRRERVYACVDMEFFSRTSAILAYVTGARQRVGLHPFFGEGNYRGDLLTHRLVYSPYLHTRTAFLGLVEALRHEPSKGCAPMTFKMPRPDGKLPEFRPSEDEKKKVAEKMAEAGASLSGRPVIILNPNAGDIIPIRKWPEGHFIELGRMICKEFGGSTIIITGTAKERRGASFIASNIPGAISLAGNTSLGELLALFCVSGLLVTNDSGPAHFAALTPIKTIVLYGPETPALYGTISPSGEAMSAGLVCSPCIDVYNYKKSLCDDNVCMRLIAPEEVFEKVKKLPGNRT